MQRGVQRESAGDPGPGAFRCRHSCSLFPSRCGDLQFGLLCARIAPLDLQFPSVHRETQETGCQANSSTLSTSTQDGPGIRFIKRNLKDCPLQASSTKFMDEYLEGHGYGPINEEDHSSHSFRSRPRYIGVVGSRFCSVSPISLQTTPASEIQDFRDLDCELYPARPFRGYMFWRTQRIPIQSSCQPVPAVLS